MDNAREIFNLLAPYVAQDNIIARPLEDIEHNINEFFTIVRYDTIVACCGLRKHPTCYEMYAFAVHQEYHHQGLGEELITLVEAHTQGKLIALSKYQGSWFIAHGFTQITAEELPKEIFYNTMRKPQIFMKYVN